MKRFEKGHFTASVTLVLWRYTNQIKEVNLSYPKLHDDAD